MKKVAVTGGSGCLGRALVKQLVDDGYSVNLLTRHPEKVSGFGNQLVTLFTGGLDSGNTLRDFTANCDVIFHVAGKVHFVPQTKIEEQEFFVVNVEGTKSLLKAAQLNNVRRVVFYSTVGVYGKDADFHGDESSLCYPITSYAMSKFEAEKIILESGGNGGPEGVILRLPVVYGPGDKGNMAKLIKAVQYRLFFHFGKGESLRSMISSENAAVAAIKAAFEPNAANNVYCITDGYDPTMNELINAISEALGVNGRPIHIPEVLANTAGRCGDLIGKLINRSFPLNSDRVRKLSSSLTFSNMKAKQELGYQAQDTLMDGIRREVNWMINSK